MINGSLIIAIDGYSSCGKSTFAKEIAVRMGYVFIDTGAMYRAVTLFAQEHSLFEVGEIENRLDEVDIRFEFNALLARSEIFLGERNVDILIRSTEINDNVSRVAGIPAVRRKLVDIQREMGRNGGVVMDGRDIGTVVFPDADIKIFMTADPVIRARRRYDERPEGVTLTEVERSIVERDRADETRADSPLRRADNAILLDNSHMTLNEQMKWFDELIIKK